MRKLLIAIIGMLAISSAWGEGYLPGRIAYLEGKAALTTRDDPEWSLASLNAPLRDGDRVYLPEQGRMELEWNNGTMVRLQGEADLEIVSSDDQALAARLFLGSMVVRLSRGASFQVQSGNATAELLEGGIYRLDTGSQGGLEVWVRKGRARAHVGDATRTLKAGNRVWIADENITALADARDVDLLDLWSDRRDAVRVDVVSSAYIPSAGYAGVYDLDLYGRWQRHSRFGDIWYPSVTRGWAPYARGRWLWRSNWGWTWISYEPWGWLPYHYGRWHYDSFYGWGWVPSQFGFWSPALVRFFFYNNYVSWCPLGPYDPANFTTFNNVNILTSAAPSGRRSPMPPPANSSAPGAIVGMPSDHFARGSSPVAGIVTAFPPATAALDGQPQIAPQNIPQPNSSRSSPTVPSALSVGRSEQPGVSPVAPVHMTEVPSGATRNSSAVGTRSGIPAFSPAQTQSAAPGGVQSAAPRITIVRAPSPTQSTEAPRRGAPSYQSPSRSGAAGPSTSAPAGPEPRVAPSRPIQIPHPSPALGRPSRGGFESPRSAPIPRSSGPVFSAPSGPATSAPAGRGERSSPSSARSSGRSSP